MKCKECKQELPKELMSIECPNCYAKGFDIEKKKIIKQLVKLKEEIRLLPNRDDEVHAKILMTDGGGVNKFVVINKIEELIGLLK